MGQPSGAGVSPTIGDIQFADAGGPRTMLTRHRLIAAAAAVGALAVAGPVAGARAQTAAATAPAPGSSIPCYPLPAFCGPDGQPASWAPWWVWPALGLTPPAPTLPFPVGQRILIPPIVIQPPGTPAPLR